MDPAARFEALMQGPEAAMPLDELALLVAAHAEPGLDVGRWLRSLDDIAARCSNRSFEGVVRHVVTEGFSANRLDYYDPRNSFLQHVIERRTGIPITLSVITIELGRRVGVPIVGIGMPGHFLVRDALDVHAFADPFEGRLLDREGCARTFAATKTDLEFDEAFLAPVGTRAIVARLLANLKGIYLARRDRRTLAKVLGLRIAMPGVPLDERRELASALAADGRYLDAARVLEDLAERAHHAEEHVMAGEAEQGANRLRARLN
jgi:regulator of sirC expression with transglutaminase-like and TPR domain